MDNIKDKEKFIGESKLLGTPETKFTFKLKKGSVTEDKLAPNAVDWDKLSQRLRDLLVAIQAAIGKAVDPDTIKEMIRNIIREMIDSGDEIIDEDALADRITQAVLNSLGEKYPPFKLNNSDISLIDDVIDQTAPSGTVGEVVFSTKLQTFLFKVTDEDNPNYGKYYKGWEGSDGYLINNNADPKKGVIFMVEDGSDYYYWDGHNLVPLGSKDDGGDAEVKVDENGITLNSNDEIALKDIPYNSRTNKVGTSYVFNTELPIDEGNTRYVIHKDIITGNVTEEAKVYLEKGSKIVPDGGISQVPVVGGEDSWVHSSDIGMIQDDGLHDTSIGTRNFNIFRALVNSKHHLILDGDYYLYTRGSGVASSIDLTRRLNICGGKLFLADAFLNLCKGGYLHAENVIFEKVPTAAGMSVFVISPDGGMVDGIEFINCQLLGNSTLYNVKILTQNVADYCPSGMTLYERWSKEALRSIGYTVIMINTDYTWIYAFDSSYRIVFRQVIDSKGNASTVVVLVDSESRVVEEQDWRQRSKEAHRLGTNMLFENPDGDTLFIKSDKTSTDKTGGYEGYYKLASAATEEEISASDGKRYAYQEASLPVADELGIKVFRMIDCYSTGRFELLDMTVRDKFEVINCRFDIAKYQVFNLGSTNTKLAAEEWLKRSCCLVFKGCEFNGPAEFTDKTENMYTCAVVAEGNAIHMDHCRLINLRSNRWANYDCYLSMGEVIFENNYIYNLFSMPRDATAEGYSRYRLAYAEMMKSKYATMIGDRKPKKIYRNNIYEFNYDEAWKGCKNYMESTYNREGEDPQTIFDNCLRLSMFSFVNSEVIDKVVIEGNIFKYKECFIKQALVSGRTSYIKDLQLRNNIFDFKSYETNWKNPLVSMKYKGGLTDVSVDISGNTFISKEPQKISMLTTSDMKYKELRVQNNNFINCSPGITCGMDTGRFKLNAENVYINNNRYDCVNGLPSVLTSTSYTQDVTDPSNNAKVMFMGDHFRLRGSQYGSVEVYDRQNVGELAEYAKIVDVQLNGYTIVKTPYMYRTLTLKENRLPKYDDTKSLIFTHSGFVPSSSWDVDISYMYNGRRLHRHMEIHARGLPSYRSVVVRDVNGYLYGDYGNGKTVVLGPLSSIDDIGLGFFFEFYGWSTPNYSGCFNLHVYTTAASSGTKNDLGTDIIIAVSSADERGKFPSNKAPDLTNFTPLRYFIGENAVVSQEWLTTMSGRFAYGSSSGGFIRGNYITDKDAGLRVYVDGRGYTCDGTQWIPDKVIVSITQAAYDALETKDANTLYVIQDTQS